jgi:hypothetical protein
VSPRINLTLVDLPPPLLPSRDSRARMEAGTCKTKATTAKRPTEKTRGPERYAAQRFSIHHHHHHHHHHQSQAAKSFE